MSKPNDVVDLLPLAVAYNGYSRAVIRLRSALEQARPQEDGLTVLAVATECLFWACSIDENLAKNDPTYDQAEKYGRSVVQGARWARNQTTHQLAFVTTGPGDSGKADVTWRPADELPPAEQERAGQRKAYDANLSGRSVEQTFTFISSFFGGEQNRPGSLLKRATGSDSI